MTTSTIILANGIELPTIAVYSRTTFFQTADRQILEIRIPSSATTFDTLRELFVKENLSEIILKEITTYDSEITEDGEIIEIEPTVNEFAHLNYSLVKELGLRENEGMFFVIVARKTELELAQEEQGNILMALLGGEE